jgi:microcystin degradation protein MlrC
MEGALSVAKEEGWEILPIIDMNATPSATVEDAVLECFWEAFLEVYEREIENGISAVYLVMHGAMVSESFPDVEGEILRRVRSLKGLAEVPLCGVLDLHGNYTDAMAHYSNALVAYYENPHTDARESAVRGAKILARLLETGEYPITVCVRPPVVLPPTGTGTADEPMRTLERLARALEQNQPEILAVNVFAGFSFADIPETGVCLSAVTVGEPEQARAWLTEIVTQSDAFWKQGNQFGYSLEEAMGALKEHKEGPIILVEPADNIGGGAPGDLTHILKALLDAKIENAAVCINDPGAVQALWEVPLGEKRTCLIGGKSGELGAEPLLLEAEVLSRSDGKFILEDRNSHAAVWGLHADMGACVVVRCQGVRILLTSLKTPPFDLAQLRSQGIVPEECFVIGVKAAVAHRRAYEPIQKASYTVDTPGPCASNLSRLPFNNIRRPIFPLDL